ncbi:MAG: hypothetical protein H8E63_07950 [Proteobacteria bacterium]|nr:hypothetical protein [Pseudomonadota bacterium]
MAVFIFVLRALGGDNGGIRSEAGKACDDFCDGSSDECTTFDPRNCETACDQLDKLDDDLSRRCEDAIVVLFDCLDNSTCEDLNDTFIPPIESLGNFFVQLEGLCPAEEENVTGECANDFVIINAIEP